MPLEARWAQGRGDREQEGETETKDNFLLNMNKKTIIQNAGRNIKLEKTISI